jgi:hypothetical protein
MYPHKKVYAASQYEYLPTSVSALDSWSNNSEPRHMLHDTLDNGAQESACSDCGASTVGPRALALVKAMTGCCHPRAGRLTERLLACDQLEQLRQLQGEVLNLLTLSFGPEEAQHRLQTLQ